MAWSGLYAQRPSAPRVWYRIERCFFTLQSPIFSCRSYVYPPAEAAELPGAASASQIPHLVLYFRRGERAHDFCRVSTIAQSGARLHDVVSLLKHFDNPFSFF